LDDGSDHAAITNFSEPQPPNESNKLPPADVIVLESAIADAVPADKPSARLVHALSEPVEPAENEIESNDIEPIREPASEPENAPEDGVESVEPVNPPEGEN
jgi:hypothetical protein